MISKVQNPITRIVALATIWTGNETANVHAVMIEIVTDCKGRAAATWNQKEAIAGWRRDCHLDELCALLEREFKLPEIAIRQWIGNFGVGGWSAMLPLWD